MAENQFGRATGARKKCAKTQKTRPVNPAPKPPVFRTSFSPNDVKEMLRVVPSETVQNALDSVLLMIKTFEGNCSHVKCRSKTTLVYHHCELCNKRYCIKHSLPEVHGCAEAAKVLERKRFLEKEKAKAHQLSADQVKTQMQKKANYQKKMAEMCLARKVKPKTGTIVERNIASRKKA